MRVHRQRTRNNREIFTDNMKALEKILHKLTEMILKVNV